jgi:hypothetical protein
MMVRDQFLGLFRSGATRVLLAHARLLVPPL